MKNRRPSPFDPRLKLLCFAFYSVLVFMLSRFPSLLLLLILLGLLWLGASLSFPRPGRMVSFFLPLFLFLMVIQVLFVPGETYLIDWGSVRLITIEGLTRGLLLGLRLFILILLTPTFFLTTPVNHIVQGMTGLGIPYKTAYLITTALNMIPSLKRDLESIMTAQKLRGLRAFEKGRFTDKLKAYPVLTVPLIMGALRRAQTMGTAMEVRGYGLSRRRSYRRPLTMTGRDLFIFLLLLLIGAGLLILDRGSLI